MDGRMVVLTVVVADEATEAPDEGCVHDAAASGLGRCRTFNLVGNGAAPHDDPEDPILVEALLRLWFNLHRLHHHQLLVWTRLYLSICLSSSVEMIRVGAIRSGASGLYNAKDLDRHGFEKFQTMVGSWFPIAGEFQIRARPVADKIVSFISSTPALLYLKKRPSIYLIRIAS